MNKQLTKCDYCNYLKDKVKIPYKKLWNMEIGQLEGLYHEVKSREAKKEVKE